MRAWWWMTHITKVVPARDQLNIAAIRMNCFFSEALWILFRFQIKCNSNRNQTRVILEYIGKKSTRNLLYTVRYRGLYWCVLLSINLCTLRWRCGYVFQHCPSSSFLRPRWCPDRCNRQLHKPFKHVFLSFSPSASLQLNSVLCIVKLLIHTQCENKKSKQPTCYDEDNSRMSRKHLHIYNLHVLIYMHSVSLSSSAFLFLLFFVEPLYLFPSRVNKHLRLGTRQWRCLAENIPQSESINRHANFSRYTQTCTTASRDVCRTCQSRWICCHHITLPFIFWSAMSLAMAVQVGWPLTCKVAVCVI